MDKYELRRKRLLELVDERADGNKAAFGRLYDYDRAQISQFLSRTYNGGNSMGEKAVTEMERRLGLPPGWFDRPETDATWPFKSVTLEQIAALDQKSLSELDAAVAFWVQSKLPACDTRSKPYIEESGTILHSNSTVTTTSRNQQEGTNVREGARVPKTSHR
jgi:hypothetical protein